MKKRMTLILMVLAVAVSAWAGRVGELEAREKASAFMAGQSKTRGEMSLTRVYLPLETKSAIWSTTDAPIYVFNNDGGGYVIVSGDDRTADILCFSEEGHIDANRLPVNMKAWLQGYVSQIERIPASATPRRVATRSGDTKANLRTKLKTAWGQGYPYDLHTPELNFVWNDNNETLHAATGCVATAMAMLLHYYQYPAELKKGIASYEGTCDIPVHRLETEEVDTVKGVKWKTEDIPAGTPIDWANITDKYDEQSTDVENDAVARLMQYCGAAVNMQYGLESGANTMGILFGMKDVMDYQDVYCLWSFEYDYQGWVDAVYDEMSQAGPVMFSGNTPSGNGHTFILDGYKSKDGKDYFYANWGWNGNDNSYVLLSVMEPESQWLVDENGNPEGFNLGQEMICGLGPQGKGCTTVPHRKFYADVLQLGLEGQEYSRSEKSEPFEVTDYYLQFENIHLNELTARVALGVYDANNKLVSKTEISEKNGITIEFYYYIYVLSDPDLESDPFPIGENLGNGTYTVMLICAEPGTDNWEPMQNAEELALTMTVSGNKCSFKAGGPTAIRQVVAVTECEHADNAWYSLSGARLSGKPTTKGIYIHQGRKVVVK